MGLKSSLLIDINNRKGNKAILLGKFNEEARSGYKAEPVQVAKEKKEVRHEGGHLVFMTKEWKSSKQISSLFHKTHSHLTVNLAGNIACETRSREK